jgi:hypothetical protein
VYVQVSISGVPADVTSDDSRQPNHIGVERAIETLRTCGITATASARFEHWDSVKDPDGYKSLLSNS